MRYFYVLMLLIIALPLQAKPVLPIETWTTAQGLRVYFVKAVEIPMLDVSIAFSAGSARDEILGQAELTAALLDQGSKNKTVDQIANGYADVGAYYSTETTRDMVVMNLKTLSDPAYRDKAFALFIETISQPIFPADAFTRKKQLQKRALAQKMQQPDWLAENKLFETLYPGHGYGHDELGTEATVEQLSTKDVQSFYSRYYVAKNGVLSIVGNINSEEAHAMASQISAALKPGEKAAALPEPKAIVSACQVPFNYPSTQTNIRMGLLGIARHNPDFYPMTVGNYILGGGTFDSQLIQELREKRGLTYSAYSYFQPMAVKGPFVMSLATRNEKAIEALDLTKQLFQQFVATEPTKEAVGDAISNINGSFPLYLDSNTAINRVILRMGFYDLPKDYLDTYREKMGKVTGTDIKRVFQQYFGNQPLCVVTVGQQVAGASGAKTANR